MSTVRIVSERDLRACVPLDLDAVAAVEEAFVALAGGDVVLPPVLRLDVPEHNGEVDVKTAFVPGMESFAIKVSSGFFDNPKIGLPSLNGLMVLLSARTGLVEALLLDNGYLTDVRTAAAGAIAAKHLAPSRVGTVAVLGAGAQARLQVEAARLVREFERVLVWARDERRALACANDLAARLGVDARAVATARDAVEQAELVVTATPSRTPLVEASWLHPQLHITAMGSDAEHKNEIAPAVLTRLDRFVCDRRAQSERLGELRHALAAGALHAGLDVVELGQVAAGDVPGRLDDDEITLCDLTGTGVQDTAIAALAAARAEAAGLGATFEA